MIDEPLLIIKASGEKVIFEPDKLLNSLKSAGASDGIANRILKQIVAGLKDGDTNTTGRIYQKAFALLKRYSRPSAPKYKLKRAVMELGPSGYPFEKYVGEIFKKQGYQTEVGVIMQGRCVSHEVDVLAEKNGKKIAIECKFGNHNGKKVDIKVALYVHSRFRDLRNQWRDEAPDSPMRYQGGIFTNGSFTSDAANYGACSGMKMVSWSYPQNGNLNQLINQARLYPITSLTFITKKEKNSLLKKGIVLCNELVNKPESLRELRVPESRIRKAMVEVESLCL